MSSDGWQTGGSWHVGSASSSCSCASAVVKSWLADGQVQLDQGFCVPWVFCATVVPPAACILDRAAPLLGRVPLAA